jgi:ferredoxin
MKIIKKRNKDDFNNSLNKFYVDLDVCIGCRLCSNLSKKFFYFDNKKNSSIVVNQPKNKIEENMIDTILIQCPVKAIKKK